ncbi:hypothetical protein [Nostoc favosum]|nr:hypothetical protein [Nostoc favosum]
MKTCIWRLDAVHIDLMSLPLVERCTLIKDSDRIHIGKLISAF